MHFSFKAGAALALLAAGLAAVPAARAGVVGDIQAFYNAPNTFKVGVLDAPTFVFENTSGTDITNSVFTIGANSTTAADSFSIGTLAAGGQFILTPGLQNDGGSGHTFFALTNNPLDTSDSGPDEDSVQFEFTGKQGAVTIDSGIFTPGATVKASGDKTVAAINFLGGGPSTDGPCNDCFDPQIVAALNTPAVPETSTRVSTALLLALGLGSVLLTFRKKKA